MAWTTPRTWSPGETVTAALMNAHVRDNLNVLKTNIADNGDVDISSQLAAIPEVLTKTAAEVQATTAETNFLNYTVPANTLSADGQMLRAILEGVTAANANNKTFKVYFGGTQVGSTLTIANSGVPWRLAINVHRRGSASQVVVWTLTYAAGNGTTIDRGTLTKDLTASQALRVTGQSGTATGDVVFDAAHVEKVP